MAALLTWYGISSMIIAHRSFRISSKRVLARLITLPRPSKYALCAPDLPSITPPVGKSGPGIYSINCSEVKSGFSIRANVASTTSPRLCGGIFVAIPTAMPLAPFTNILG